jgi:hypothetical protein
MKIIHLGQLHKKPFGHKPTREFLDCVVDSQLKIIEYIKTHPTIPVLHEGLDVNLQGGNFLETVKARAIFPNGIPEKSALNKAQKEYLYEHGGVFVMYFWVIYKKYIKLFIQKRQES